jgi:uncharacterized protein YbjT (DUF2867 family)
VRLPAGARVVLLSEQDTGCLQPDHWSARVERAVRDGGRPWTMVRPSWFMDVLTDPRFYRDDVAAGRLPFAGGGARVAWVDARDIAAVAAAALLENGHAGAAYEVTGPQALTLPETVSVLSDALGREVVHEEIGIGEAAEGSEGFDRDELVWTLERLAAGGFAAVSGDVEQVTGRAPRSLATFAADHRDAL